MKKHLILINTILILSLISSTNYAQKNNSKNKPFKGKFSISIIGGFSISQDETNAPLLKKIKIPDLEEVEGGAFSLARSPGIGISFGYEPLEYLSVNVDFDYLYKPKTPESQELRSQLYNYLIFEFSSKGSIKGTSLSLLYDIAYPYRKLLKLNFYIGAGIGFYFGDYTLNSKFKYLKNISQFSEFTPVIEKFSFKFKPALGYYFTYKVKKNISRRTFIFAQGKIISLNFKTKKIVGSIKKEADTSIPENIDEKYELLPEDFVNGLSYLKLIKSNSFFVNFGVGIKF